MSFTLATLKTAIQDYLETDETTFVNNLNTFIEQAEERILKAVQIPDQRKNVSGNVSPTSFIVYTNYDLGIIGTKLTIPDSMTSALGTVTITTS